MNPGDLVTSKRRIVAGGKSGYPQPGGYVSHIITEKRGSIITVACGRQFDESVIEVDVSKKKCVSCLQVLAKKGWLP